MVSGDSYGRFARIRLTSANLSDVTYKANGNGITLYEISVINELTLEAVIRQKHLRLLQQLAEERGEQLEILGTYGLGNWLLGVRKRRMFLICLFLYILMCLYLPTRTLFVLVEGNETVSTERILAAAEALGVSFGASRRAVRSERIKNGLLADVPELQWAGVNTYGCVAVVAVRERITEQNTPVNAGVCNVVAKLDGVIREIVAYRGAVACKVGQAVKRGDVLVSGVIDCGTHLLTTAAKAEIYGSTRREMVSFLPATVLQRGRIAEKTKKYSLIIGKKLINLYKGSGISDTGCVKMYKEYYCKLPGGFSLPVAIAVEEEFYFELHPGKLDESYAREQLLNGTKRYLLDTMVSGRILSSDTDIQQNGESLILNGQYYCYEMIGQLCDEEIMINYERYGENP